MKDSEFARQAIVGANPMSINWAKDGKLPEAFNWGKCDLCKSSKMESLRSNGKMFYVDLAIQDGVSVNPGRYLYPAIAVFYADEAGDLQPLGVQLTRNGDGKDRVYTPKESNKWTWLFAKMHYMSSEALYHQAESAFIVSKVDFFRAFLDAVDVNYSV